MTKFCRGVLQKGFGSLIEFLGHGLDCTSVPEFLVHGLYKRAGGFKNVKKVEE